jgi:signal transduction histidine kinase|nr:HAMP domain-containing sensor histidine kinase [uncultured Blautia sp.]
MRIFANKDIKRIFFAISAVLIVFFLAAEGCVYFSFGQFLPGMFPVFMVSLAALWTVCFLYFYKQDQLMEHGILKIHAYLDGDADARIECDDEGTIYRLFHSVNSMAAVLNAHATKEMRQKEFLKNTISDISHQLKTPLAALNIYNGLLLEETENMPEIKEFASLSEQELDRIETLVQNLLKLTKLDAGSVVIEKTMENVSDMMKDIELHFAYRAREEQKTIILSGSDTVSFLCDRDWLTEAIDNIVKNALDHMSKGDTVQIAWKRFSGAVQIVVEDTGCGIHPEDLPYIFKRFYRSRFSGDRQGIGLGLPLAKAIVEAHSGTVEVDSVLGKGTVFTMNFLIPTKL